MDRGAWRATVHRVAESRTRLRRLSTYAETRAWSSQLWTSAPRCCSPLCPLGLAQNQIEDEASLKHTWSFLFYSLPLRALVI